MPKAKKKRTFAFAFKQSAVQRMEAGENVSSLARELKLRRKLLYEWRAAFRKRDSLALASPAQPPNPLPALVSGSKPVFPSVALRAAHQRIIALERKVGRQELELDFFAQALRHIEASLTSNASKEETCSTKPSRSKPDKAN